MVYLFICGSHSMGAKLATAAKRPKIPTREKRVAPRARLDLLRGKKGRAHRRAGPRAQAREVSENSRLELRVEFPLTRIPLSRAP